MHCDGEYSPPTASRESLHSAMKTQHNENQQISGVNQGRNTRRKAGRKISHTVCPPPPFALVCHDEVWAAPKQTGTIMPLMGDLLDHALLGAEDAQGGGVGYEPCLQELPEGWPGLDLTGQARRWAVPMQGALSRHGDLT